MKLLILADSRQGYNQELKQWYTHNAVRRDLWDLSLGALPDEEEDIPNPNPILFRADAMVSVDCCTLLSNSRFVLRTITNTSLQYLTTVWMSLPQDAMSTSTLATLTKMTR